MTDTAPAPGTTAPPSGDPAPPTDAPPADDLRDAGPLLVVGVPDDDDLDWDRDRDGRMADAATSPEDEPVTAPWED